MTLAPDLELEESVSVALGAKDNPTSIEMDPAARRQLTMAAVARRSAEAADEKVLLADAARLVAESLDLPSCAVAVTDKNSGKLSFWYCNLADVGPQGKDVHVPQAANASLAGFAMQAGRPVVCSDLSQEKRFSDAMLRKVGVHSALACPLESAEGPWGALLAMSPTPKSFQAEDVLLLDAISGMASTSIARRRAEMDLARQERVRKTILETLDALVLELTPEGRILTFNRACQQTTGFAPAEVKDRHVWNAFLVPEEVMLVQAAFDRLHNGHNPVTFQSYLLTKHGQRRRISWSFSMLLNAQEDGEALIGTGVDITERCELEEKLEQSELATDEARRSLAVLMEKIESGELVFRANESQQPFSEIPEGENKERRRKPRRSYPYLQKVAPVVDGKLPTKDMFQAMHCKDIAAGGFSFISPRKPTYTNCVVAFGVAPSLTYLMARIVHTHLVEVDGNSVYIVGCEYTGRVEY